MIVLMFLMACGDKDVVIDTSDSEVNIAPTITEIDAFATYIYESFSQSEGGCERGEDHGSHFYEYTDFNIYVEDFNGLDDIRTVLLYKEFTINYTESVSAYLDGEYWSFNLNDVVFNEKGKYNPIICVEDYSGESNCYDLREDSETNPIYEIIRDCVEVVY